MSGSGGPLDGYYSQLGQLRSVTDGWRTMPGPIRPLSETQNELTQGAPTWADAWEHNKAAYQDWAEKQRVAGVAAGEIDPETGWPTPAGARSAATSTAMGLVMGSTAPEFQAPRVANPLRAYHGSPHEFAPTERNPLGEFDPAKVGTGEGAQMYGVGAGYLAENEAIAQHYRDTLSGAGGRTPGASDGMSLHGINGQYPPTGQAGHAAMDTAIDLDGLLTYMHNMHNQPVLHGQDLTGSYQGMIDYYRSKIEGRIDRFRDQLGSDGPRGIADRDMAAQADYYDKHVRDAEPSDVMKRPKGHMYEAEVHIDPEHMLHWDLPLSQQSKYVQERLGKLGVDDAKDLTGGQVYHELESVLGTGKTPGNPDAAYYRALPAEVSEALRDAGIPALRYADANSRQPMQTWHDHTENLRDDITYYQAQLKHSDALAPQERAKIEEAMKLKQEQLAWVQTKKPDIKHNMVVFDPATINIVRRYGISALIGGGAAAGAAQGEE